MQIPRISLLSDEDTHDLFHNLTILNRQVVEISTNQKDLMHRFELLLKEHNKDHDELLRMLVTRDFFWKIIVKIGVPMLFVMFGIGWGVGKFAQHISSALGW